MKELWVLVRSGPKIPADGQWAALVDDGTTVEGVFTNYKVAKRLAKERHALYPHTTYGVARLHLDDEVDRYDAGYRFYIKQGVSSESKYSGSYEPDLTEELRKEGTW